MGDLYRSNIADIDISKPLRRENVGALLAEGDALANRYGANVFRGDEPVDLTGYKAECWFIRPSKDTLTYDCVIDGNSLYIDLPAECYAMVGMVVMTFKLVKGDVTTTIRIVDGYVRETQTDVAAGNVAVSIKDAVERAEAAADRAEAAGGGSTGNGTPGQDGEDGFSPVATVTQTSTGATISITDATGTTTATITNGKDGQDGKPGADGSAGADGVSPTITASKSGKVTTLTIKDASGTKTATINDGADGAAGKDGSNGADGTSVTVKSVSESTEDGGNNVVTFSDGKTVTVKNGSTGAKGAKGDPGEDYVLTEADKEEIAGIVPIVKVAESPVFVDSVDDMKDTSKMYVLKTDGMFYSYKTVTTTTEGSKVPNFTNRATTFKENYRFKSTGAEEAETGTTVIEDYIPFVTGDVVRLKGINLTGKQIVLYDTNKAYVTSEKYGTPVALTHELDGDTYKITSKTSAKVKYVRFCGVLTGSKSDVVITINESITYTETDDVTEIKHEWSSTGIAYNQPADYEDRVIALETTTANNSADINVIKQQIANIESGETATVIPEWWEDEVADTIAKIKALQVGRDCITFPFFSDNHQRNGYAGILIKRVMDECHIPYCFFGGDGIANGYFGDETDAEMREQDAAFDAATAAIPAWQFCRAIGNHEYYWKVSSSETHYYTSDQVYEVFMRENTLAQSKEFGGDTYYYVEDKASKTRFIVMDMNTLDDSAQITWLQNTALSFPESGWAVVLIGHQPVTEHYATVINGAAAARTVLKNYINGSATNKADVVGWFAGHIHRDRIFAGVAANPGYNGSTDPETDAATGDPISEVLPWKTVSIISDNVSIGYGGVKHAIDNSDQSHAIDFVTINKATKTVNLTRLGFGSDRSYTY